MSIRSELIRVLETVAAEQGRQLAPLSDEVGLLESGLDSLCLAIIVARLEDRFGVDPFASEDDTGFPVTIGEFVALYEKAARAA